ncbi:MAG: hypothetical protein II943_00485 [Victivallales bacterium]|nr:hypothetical protein [Victivallales bacterium]
MHSPVDVHHDSLRGGDSLPARCAARASASSGVGQPPGRPIACQPCCQVW